MSESTVDSEHVARRNYPPFRRRLLVNLGLVSVPILLLYSLSIVLHASDVIDFHTAGHGRFGEDYPVALIMIVAAFIAGSTPEGGNAIAFPLLTALQVTSNVQISQARDFGVLIQSVGMTSAAAVNLLNRFPINKFALFWGVVGSFPSLLSLMFVDLDSHKDAVKVLFSSLFLAFGFSLFLACHLGRQGGTRPSTRSWKVAAVYALAGLFGGATTGMFGTGLDTFVFSVSTLFFGNDLRIAQTTSVIIMSCCSLSAVAIRVLQGAFRTSDPFFSHDYPVWSWWYVSIPIVACMAPLGSTLAPYLSSNMFLLLVVGAALLQYISGLTVAADPSLVVFGSLVLVAGVIVLQLLFRFNSGKSWVPQEKLHGYQKRASRSNKKFSRNLFTQTFASEQMERNFVRIHMADRSPFSFVVLAFGGISLAYAVGRAVSLSANEIASHVLYPALVSAALVGSLVMSLLPGCGGANFQAIRRWLAIALALAFNSMMVLIAVQEDLHPSQIMFIVVSIVVAPLMFRILFRDFVLAAPFLLTMPLAMPWIVGKTIDLDLLLVVFESVLFGLLTQFISENYARSSYAAGNERDMHLAQVKKEAKHRRIAQLHQIKAEASMKAEATFSAYVFHELRGPLGGVVEHMRFARELLASDPLKDLATNTKSRVLEGEALAEVAGQMRQLSGDVSDAIVCCDHVSEILNSLLDLGKMDAHKMTLSEDMSSPFEISNSCAKMLCHTVKPGVELIVEEAVSDMIVVDLTRVRQIVINLLSNAIRHTQTPGGSVTLSTFLLPMPKGDAAELEFKHEKVARTESAESVSVSISIEDLREPMAAVVSNRCRLNSDGEAVVGIVKRDFEEERRLLRIVVEDTGTGVPESMLLKVFDRYSSLGVGGTGLGLPLVASFVELMKGSIRCKSPLTPAGGTRFSVDIPVASSVSKSFVQRRTIDSFQPTSKKKEEGMAKKFPPLVSLQDFSFPKEIDILVVDDQQVPSRRIIVRRLEALFPWRAAISEASSGEEALDLITGVAFFCFLADTPAEKGRHFHLISMDENMGSGLKGSETIRLLRRHEALSATAVPPAIIVSLTANATRSDLARYLKAGANLVWSKPLPSPEFLAQQLSQCFTNWSQFE